MNKIYATFVEILYSIWCMSPDFLGATLGLWDKNKHITKQTPIVLLHGWFASNNEFIKLKKRLHKLGYRVYMPNLGFHLEGIERVTKKFHKYIQKRNLKNYILIGHSFGGILGLYYLYYYTNHKKSINKIIAIGSPLNGSNASYIGFFSKSTMQLVRKSKLIQNLNKSLNKINLKNFYSIGSNNDPFIPRDASFLKGANNISTNAKGHIALLFSKDVLRKVEGVVEGKI